MKDVSRFDRQTILYLLFAWDVRQMMVGGSGWRGKTYRLSNRIDVASVCFIVRLQSPPMRIVRGLKAVEQ
jgi:hypothetical protein